jgi:hypothetical protein
MPSPASARLDLPALVKAEPFNRSSADSCDSVDFQPVGGPSKVPRPAMTARMKQGHEYARGRIRRKFEGEFLLLPREAAQREIGKRGPAAPASWDDMVDSESIRKEGFRRLTVFAAVASALCHPRVEPSKILPATLHSRARPVRREDNARSAFFCVARAESLFLASIRASALSTATRYSSSMSPLSSARSCSVAALLRHLASNRSIARPRRRSRFMAAGASATSVINLSQASTVRPR